MNKNFKELVAIFKKIARKKWIKSVTKGHGNIGLTFEKELEKNVDTNYTPDYKDIEIKCTTRFSRYPISLFSIAFDGPTDKEIIRINEKYGSFDKYFYDKKTLIRKLRCNELSILESNFYLSLKLEKDKLFLCVFDKDTNLIEKESYVYLDTIKDHLLTKIQNLAIIKASKKKINDTEFYRYYQINLYTLKSFDIFIELLKTGIIEVSLISRISKSGPNAGKYYNKNLVFQIKKKDIKKLFDELYYFNSDSKENADEIQFL